MIQEKLKRLKQQINYVCYDKAMIDKLQKVWETFYELETEVKEFYNADVIKSVCDLDGKTVPVTFKVTKMQPSKLSDEDEKTVL